MELNRTDYSTSRRLSRILLDDGIDHLLETVDLGYDISGVVIESGDGKGIYPLLDEDACPDARIELLDKILTPMEVEGGIKFPRVLVKRITASGQIPRVIDGMELYECLNQPLEHIRNHVVGLSIKIGNKVCEMCESVIEIDGRVHFIDHHNPLVSVIVPRPSLSTRRVRTREATG